MKGENKLEYQIDCLANSSKYLVTVIKTLQDSIDNLSFIDIVYFEQKLLTSIKEQLQSVSEEIYQKEMNLKKQLDDILSE